MNKDLRLTEDWDEIPCVVKEAFWNQLAGNVTESYDNPLPLETYMLSKRFARVHDVGTMTVAGDRIRGKVGLDSDFDEWLQPRDPYIRRRWTRIDWVRFHAAVLPRINLLKIGDTYLVLDGHHRLSVASVRKLASVTAHVIEIEVPTECQGDQQGAMSTTGAPPYVHG